MAAYLSSRHCVKLQILPSSLQYAPRHISTWLSHSTNNPNNPSNSDQKLDNSPDNNPDKRKQGEFWLEVSLVDTVKVSLITHDNPNKFSYSQPPE